MQSLNNYLMLRIEIDTRNDLSSYLILDGNGLHYGLARDTLSTPGFGRIPLH
jgi:hypothetical protein